MSIVLTRESLLRLAKFQPVTEFRSSHRVIKKAHKSSNEAVALKAAELNLKLADAFPDSKSEGSDPSRPIAVQIVLAGSNAVQQLGGADERFVLRALPPVVSEPRSESA